MWMHPIIRVRPDGECSDVWGPPKISRSEDSGFCSYEKYDGLSAKKRWNLAESDAGFLMGVPIRQRRQKRRNSSVPHTRQTRRNARCPRLVIWWVQSWPKLAKIIPARGTDLRAWRSRGISTVPPLAIGRPRLLLSEALHCSHGFWDHICAIGRGYTYKHQTHA